jgi:hypothetical protein
MLGPIQVELEHDPMGVCATNHTQGGCVHTGDK